MKNILNGVAPALGSDLKITNINGVPIQKDNNNVESIIGALANSDYKLSKKFFFRNRGGGTKSNKKVFRKTKRYRKK